MKFSAIAAGAEKTSEVKIKLKGTDVAPLVRPLTMAEEMEVGTYAIAVAKAAGAEPEKGNDIFDAATMAKAIEIAYLDESSPSGKRERFFDTGPDGVTELDKDTIALLFERQELAQQESSPGFSEHSAAELFAMIREMVSEEGQSDPFFFLRYAPSTRMRLVRFMAALLAASPVLKSSSTSNSSPLPTPT